MTVDAVDLDTDVLGTFSGDVPRPCPPLETAIRKARLGMEATGETLGLASEGSIGPDPGVPLLTSDREIVVLVDAAADITIWEAHTSYDTVTATTTAGPGSDLLPFLTRSDFPHHQLIVRPNRGRGGVIYKGLEDPVALHRAVDAVAPTSADGLARVESDLRAHASPSRRLAIAGAASRLARRVAACCPECGTPGWGCVGVVTGVPCARCGTQLEQPSAEVDGCQACAHRTERPVGHRGPAGDPATCPHCNP
jgi:hypothetical protein